MRMKEMRRLWFLTVMLIMTLALTGCGGGGGGGDDELEKVKSPVISPKGGTFINKVSVTIATQTEGAVIRYTTDGSEPTENSNIYNGELSLTQTTVLKAKAFNTDMEASDTVSETFTIEKGMVLVPAGTTSANNGSITVSQDYYIGKYEVTQAEWEAVMTGNSNGISATPSYFAGKPNNPVESVSWYDTMVFCNRKSIAEGLTPVYSISGTTNPDSWGASPDWENNATWNAVTVNSSANGYRLPTDAEWEYAARGGAGGSATTYAGSNNIGEVAWYYYNSGNTSHTVGTKLPNELGIYDMSGNVWEWCYDWYPGYEGSRRVGRGGGWRYYDNHCTVSHRYIGYPYYCFNGIGLRLARSF